VRRVITEARGSDRLFSRCTATTISASPPQNSLAAIAAGARRVECTINASASARQHISRGDRDAAARAPGEARLECGIDTTQITRTSRLVAELTGTPVQPNKAVVGANAFAHASGIHQDGVLKDR